MQVRRSQPLAMLHVFDQPVMETNCERRTVSTVATQSLMLMNSDFVLQQAGYFAARIRKEAAGDPTRQVQVGLATGLRPRAGRCRSGASAGVLAAQTIPRRRQLRRCAERAPAPARRHAAAPVDPLVNLCQVLLSTNEFLYVE